MLSFRSPNKKLSSIVQKVPASLHTFTSLSQIFSVPGSCMFLCSICSIFFLWLRTRQVTPAAAAPLHWKVRSLASVPPFVWQLVLWFELILIDSNWFELILWLKLINKCHIMSPSSDFQKSSGSLIATYRTYRNVSQRTLLITSSAFCTTVSFSQPSSWMSWLCCF